MIAKNIEPCVCSEGLAQHAAYVQMASHLSRQFQNDPDVWVFNNLQFSHRGSVMVIDHLLLTTWGLFVVESRSLIADTRVDRRGVWSQRQGDAWQTISSPLETAENQLAQLRAMLDDNAPLLLGKLLGFQKRFVGFHGQVYCAISDQGCLSREKPQTYLNAMPANRVARALENALFELKRRSVLKAAFAFGKDPVLQFSSEELLRIREFLLSSQSD